MVLNLINFVQAAIVWILIIPDLLFAIHHPPKESAVKNHAFNIIEQFGRYVSMVLMILPLGIREFGFSSPEEMIIYFAANGILLAVYIITYLLFSKKQNLFKAMLLSAVRIGIFALCGIILRHWLLAASSAIFAIGHIFTTLNNYKEK